MIWFPCKQCEICTHDYVVVNCECWSKHGVSCDCPAYVCKKCGGAPPFKVQMEMLMADAVRRKMR